MTTYSRRMRRLTTLGLATLMISVVVAVPASAVAISWIGTNTSATSWTTTTSNWSGGVVPGSADDVTFTGTGAVASPTVTNTVDANTTINSLRYSQENITGLAHTTKIDSGVTLKISGTSPIATVASNGSSSLYAGNPGTTATSVSQTVITGGGTLDVSNAIGGTTGGDIIVRVTQGTAGVHPGILDLQGLASFNASVDQLLVGVTTSSSEQRPQATLYLAQSNTITLNNPGTVLNAGLIIGYAGGNANGSNPTTVYLGQTNNINVDNVTVAGRRSTATLTLNPAFSSSSPSLTMRGSAGGASRVATISIGDNTNNGTGSTNTANGTINLTGVNADIKATSIVLGTSTATGTGNGATGTLTFNAGTIDATGMILGNQVANFSGTNTGNVNVSGTGNLVVGSSGIILGKYVGPTGISNGNLNISGGTVTLGGNITDGGGTSTINLTGGNLDMQTNSIGAIGAPIDNVTVRGGTVSNMGSLSVTNFSAAGPISLPTGTLTLTNAGKIDMRDSAGNALTAGTLSLPASSSFYYELSASAAGGNDQINLTTLNLSGVTTINVTPLSGSYDSNPYSLITYTSKTGAGTFTVNNTSRSGMSAIDTGTAVDLTVTYVAARDLTWTSGTTGTWDLSVASNWTSSYGADKYYDLDTVNFGNNVGAPATITLQNASGLTGFSPGSVTVDSSGDYIFNAFGANDKISGTTGLTKNGTGALTINLANNYTGQTNLNNGKIILGNNAALGSTTSALAIANGATLDLNKMQLFAKPVTAQGAGVDGNGAIVNNDNVNSPGGTQYDVSNLTLSGNTTIGGISSIGPTNPGLPGNQYIGRWSIRASSGTAILSTGGNAYNLTKTGNNQIMLVNVSVDTALADIFINKGVLGLEGSTNLGDPSKTLTVDGTGGGQPSGGAMLQLRNVTAPLNKNILLQNNGVLYSLLSSSSTDNTISGMVTIADSGGIFNTGGLRDDYAANSAARMSISGVIAGSSSATLIKTGPANLTVSNLANTFTGPTNVNQGTLTVTGNLLSFVTVNNTATLSGTGSVGGLAVNTGGTLTPGSSPGQLTINGNATLGGTIVAEINGSVAGTGYDQIVVNGPASNVSLGGTLNAIKDALFSPDPINDKFWIVVNNSLNALSGVFSNYANGTEVFLDNGNSWTIHYGADSASGSLAGGNDVVIAIVPEPATLVMLIIAAGLCLMFRRYRNK